MEPLAERIRPQKLEDYISQTHLIGPGSLTQQMRRIIPSLILGTRARVKQHWHKLLRKNLNALFHLECHQLWCQGIREVIDKAKQSGGMFTTKILFYLLMIHRFSKSQQDSLLAAVEKVGSR
jgi:putative ATPase